MTQDGDPSFDETAEPADEVSVGETAEPALAPADQREPSRPSVDAGVEIPWRVTLFLLLAILVVVFAVQNTQSVELRFLGWSWELPLVIIILGTVVVSVLLDEVLGGIIKRRRRLRRLEREELRRLRGDS
ncbi:MAG TPA: lipopolysaccharide assembly protein LapA domain-containing protein [Acidimicrobiia bacterium]|nr:lipopolysaccharide assembly protein LapA domain-containing protein [Acidimicrobiia bacterium]